MIQAVNASGQVVSYAYDNAGRRSTMTDPQGGIFTYVYDNASRLTQLTNPQGKIATESYDAAGRLVQQIAGNGTISTFVFDAAGRKTNVINGGAGGSIVNSFTYTFDKVGNKTQVNEANGDVTTWQYDASNQLLQESRSGLNGFSVTHAYDPAGNRTLQVDGGVPTTFTYDQANQILTAQEAGVGTTTYTHDANGNRTEQNASAGVTYYGWDEENHMTTAEPPAGPVTMAYNADGKRVQKQTASGTTNFLYDFEKLLEETDGSGHLLEEYTATEKVYGDLLSAYNGTASSYHQFDSLGSTDALLDDTGSLKDKWVYRAYGQAAQTQGTDPEAFTFVGQQGYFFDLELQLYFASRRHADPNTARWLSQDEARSSSNLYEYCENNPLNQVDPSGLQFAKSAAVGAVPGLKIQQPSNQWDYLRGLQAGEHEADPLNLYGPRPGSLQRQLEPEDYELAPGEKPSTDYQRGRDEGYKRRKAQMPEKPEIRILDPGSIEAQQLSEVRLPAIPPPPLAPMTPEEIEAHQRAMERLAGMLGEPISPLERFQHQMERQLRKGSVEATSIDDFGRGDTELIHDFYYMLNPGWFAAKLIVAERRIAEQDRKDDERLVAMGKPPIGHENLLHQVPKEFLSGLGHGSILVGDALTFGKIAALHKKAETLIAENGPGYAVASGSAVIAREAIILILSGGAGKILQAGKLAEGGRALTWLTWGSRGVKGAMAIREGAMALESGQETIKAARKGDVPGVVIHGILTLLGALGVVSEGSSALKGLFRARQALSAGESALSPGAQLRAKYGDVFSEFMRYRKQGFTPAQSKYLTEPYEGLGHHFPIRQSTARNWGLPDWLRDTRFNVLKPRGISRGRFYELHYKVDPSFRRAGFPKSIGGQWQGSQIGLEKYGFWGRWWYGTPGPTKVGAGVGVIGGGAAAGHWLFGGPDDK